MTLFAFASTLEFSRMFPGLVSSQSENNQVTNKVIPLAVDGAVIGGAAILGVGLLEFATNLSRLLSRKDELGITSVILVGICGAYRNRGLSVGDVVRVDSEIVGDLGAQERDGSFTAWSRIGGGDIVQYKSASLEKAPRWVAELRGASGLSVNCCTGTDSLAESRALLFDCDVESMEGAACFSVCNAFDVPAFEIRAVSNLVGSRDKSSWRIPEALTALRNCIISA